MKPFDAFQESTPVGELHTMEFKFEGSTYEYSKLWLFNAMMAITTFGIYAAWGKVQNRKYLMQHTFLNDLPLDFVAKPKAILIGRLIFLLGLGLVQLMPETGLLTMIGFLLVMPLLSARALAFNMNNTCHRNIRFGFEGTWIGAVMANLLPYLASIGAVIVLSFLVPLTIGIFGTSLIGNMLTVAVFGAIVISTFGYYLYKQTAFKVNHLRYGDARMSTDASLDDFKEVMLKAFGIFMALAFLCVLFARELMTNPTVIMAIATKGQTKSEGLGLIFALAAYLVFLTFYIPYIYAKVNARNTAINRASLDGKIFLKSQASPTVLTWIHFTNSLMIIVSCGLLIPVAKLRAHRYELSYIRVNAVGHPKEIIIKSADSSNTHGSFADAATSSISMDVGI